MLAYRYYELEPYTIKEDILDVVSWNDNIYSAVSIWCKRMPKVLYDTICTLTELRYFVFHGNFYADGAEAYQMVSRVENLLFYFIKIHKLIKIRGYVFRNFGSNILMDHVSNQMQRDRK
ncbi:putative ACT domain-containing protein ACR1-12 [Helianthus annuus]|nr:putative ACT domain-containing protein ACR1-12 [Helianthus annuus]